MTSVKTVLREQTSLKTGKYTNSFLQSKKALDKVGAKGAANINGLIVDLRKEIQSRLAVGLPSDPTAPFLTRIIPDMTRDVNDAIAEFSRKAGIEITERLEDGFVLGEGVTANALKLAGIPISFPSVTPEILSTIAGSATTVLEDVTSSLGRRINSQVRLAATGLQSSSVAINSISDMLKTSKEVKKGLRKRVGFGYQAESIVRTEVNRVYSNAQQLSSEQISETIPGLRKRWSHVGTRRGHRETDARYAPGGEVGPIPINQKFVVTDYSRTGRTNFLTLGGKVKPHNWTAIGQQVIGGVGYSRRGSVVNDRMMYPRDAAGSPGNVVNCTCVVLDVLPDTEEVTNKVLGRVE